MKFERNWAELCSKICLFNVKGGGREQLGQLLTKVVPDKVK